MLFMSKKTRELEKETQRCLEESDKIIARAEKKNVEIKSHMNEEKPRLFGNIIRELVRK